MISRIALRTAIIAPLLAGCTVGPNFHAPQTQSPQTWASEPKNVGSTTFGGPVEEDWWKSFHDPELASLEARLAPQNIDLQTAAERVKQAEDVTQVTASQGLPQVSGTSEYTRERESPNGAVSLVEPAPGAPLAFDTFENLLQASWELDLFGKVGRATEAAHANTTSAVEARHAIALKAIADLAQDYMELRGTQARLAITEDDLGLAQHNLALVRDQFANGVATTLDIANAEAQIATITASITPFRERISRLINAIGFLLALPPRALTDELAEPAALPMVPPQVPVGLPSTLLLRRPDIREAEAKLHAATAETGVAVASFYPDITLGAHAGLQGLQLGNAFSLPDLEYTIGPQITVPLFEGGRLTGTLKLRRSQQKEAALDYRQTVLQAWQDVDNALTAYADGQEQRDQLANAVDKNRTALFAARQNFAQGTVDFLNVTAAQSALLNSQDALAQADTDINVDLIGLYKALGGGWAVVDDAPQP
ncbi:efflux transporter outer membrane subunit [Acidisoma cellulosilytica]|uniref:Efflux transporter outer membrane subunit n=1 Tax=Acidisoma cellulosilyticum TaxID=2802395 RepID=A0A963Z907_9PROT|nr:efflux transporter outer membrane subunit [Acidisoma cellulosilyticum]MCB8884082.1 efflux transporter outer membrane subunit [Acidisoma cellulosilyticum]